MAMLCDEWYMYQGLFDSQECDGKKRKETWLNPDHAVHRVTVRETCSSVTALLPLLVQDSPSECHPCIMIFIYLLAPLVVQRACRRNASE